MPRLETKSAQVAPNQEQSTIDLYQKFGWTLLSSQEIYSKNSHIESRGGQNYSVTETTNYVKLTFQRDKDMPNYDKIVPLENEYFALANSIPVNDGKGKGLRVLGIIATIIGAWVLIEGLGFAGSAKATSFAFLLPLFGFLVLGGGIAGIVFGSKKKKKAEAEYQVRYNEHMEKMRAVLEEVDPYC